MNIVYVMLGGGAGAVFRYLTLFLNSSLFPFGTILVNTLGSFVLGLITSWFMRKKISKAQSLFYGTGLCGGFTTMSTFSKEVYELFHVNARTATIYMAASTVLGIAAGVTGLKLGSLAKVKGENR
ncbi:CrcB protein [Bacillus ectoiniformans]|uniref:fluoride efflux transporter FluC n=1 Tax=Bacillus ectoiniformans TaxID=1494429 RepID=UPI0019589326|nr:CrcB family protein [Bacillus ectoiniformans]MBM7647306.1 CrcB protein [Bacillus ectoiniformans]